MLNLWLKGHKFNYWTDHYQLATTVLLEQL